MRPDNEVPATLPELDTDLMPSGVDRRAFMMGAGGVAVSVVLC